MASDWPSKEPMVAASSTPGALTSRLSQQTAKSSWFWLVNIILIPLVCFFWCLYIFGLNDGKKFCATASERDAMNPPAFLHNPASNTHNNTGGRACIYDIVDYVNGFRAGKDKLVGTNDDRLSLSEQMELLNRLFRQEFPGSYWSNSTWFFNHNAAVLGQMQLLYADANEYLAFFGSSLPSTGYSGTHSYDCYDFQIDVRYPLSYSFVCSLPHSLTHSHIPSVNCHSFSDALNQSLPTQSANQPATQSACR
eukprot:GHVU01161853.1.p1 GENE.GHVU01161853.1~~GHVU01161853.1.p1  ORF type:complete len:251 (+),score=22.03 GHVU01161853.1:223-975(+)